LRSTGLYAAAKLIVLLLKILNCPDFLTGNPVCTEVEPVGV